MRTFFILSVAICSCLSSCRNGNEKSAAAGLNVDKAKIRKIYEKLEKRAGIIQPYMLGYMVVAY